MRTLSYVAAAAAVATASVSETSAVNPVWGELARVDCKGVGHMMPDGPMAAHFDFGIFRAGLDFMHERIAARANAYCEPTVPYTAEIINRRFVPSMDALMTWILGGSFPNGGDECLETAFVMNYLEHSGFMNLMTTIHDECPRWDYYGMMLDVSGMFPSESCSLTTWRVDGKCRMQFKLQPVWGDMTLQASIERCDNAATPFMSLTCKGDSCEKLLKPCTANSQCGDHLACSNLANVIPETGQSLETLVSDTLATAFKTAGLWHTSMPNNLVPSLVIRPLREFLGSYFVDDSVGSSFSDYMKFCLPGVIPATEGSAEQTLDNIVDLVNTIFPESTCTAGNKDTGYNCTYNGWNQVNYVECGCGYNGKRRPVEASLIFQTNDAELFSCSSTGSEDAFTADCPESGHWGSCYNRDRVFSGNSDYLPYACHVASNGECNFAFLGDGACDSACNIAECKWDGYDCQESYTASLESRTRNGCNSQEVLDVESSPCVDDASDYYGSGSYCASYMREKERGWLSQSCGPSSYLKDCCVCNQTTVYTTSAINSHVRVSRAVLSCNQLFSWDGMLPSGDDVSTLKDVTTAFPAYEAFNPATGETQLFSFDCDGYFAMGLVVPFGRAWVPGPLAAFRKLEQIMISLVAKRQELEGGPALVTDSGDRLNRLGLMHFGIYTPLHMLLQLTPALRTETQSDDWNYYAGTTPVSKILRKRDDSYVWGVNLPSSCDFSTYANTRLCLLQYVSPIFTALEWDLKATGGMKECAASHLPEIVVSAKGDFFYPSFPFASPCLADEDCGTDHVCANLLQKATGAEMTSSGYTLAELEYDVFTFILFGREGRVPGWGERAPANSWITDDIKAILNAVYGDFDVDEKLSTNLPAFDAGEFKVCFHKNDPLLLKLVTTGNVANFSQVISENNIQLITSQSVAHSGYTHNMAVYTIPGMNSVSQIPIGMDTTVFSTKAPTNPGETPAPTMETGSGSVSGTILATFMTLAVVFSSCVLLLL